MGRLVIAPISHRSLRLFGPFRRLNLASAMPETGLHTAGEDEIWRRLASEMAGGAEYDSSEGRPFSPCHPDTRVDLLDTLEAAISQDDQHVDWLLGDSGSGKSSVACSLAERFQVKGRLASTFFFSRKDVKRSNTESVCLTIAYQVGLLHYRAKEAIVKAIRNDPHLLSPGKSRQIQFDSLVSAPLRTLRNVWSAKRIMIFDGADEGKTGGSDDQIDVLVHMLVKLLRDPTIPIAGILLTSQPLVHRQALNSHPDIAGITRVHNIDQYDATLDIELYLRYTFQRIYTTHNLSLIHPRQWPSETLLDMLLRRVNGKFIVATTISRHIEDSQDPINSLSTILSKDEGEAERSSQNHIDSVYGHILSDNAARDSRPEVECLADIAALASPLSLSSICKLFGSDVRKHISHLQSIIRVPPIDSPLLVQIHHASFYEYLADKSRSGALYVNPADSHLRLFRACMRTMQKGLKRNIVGFDQFGNAHMPVKGSLHYACLAWPLHLEQAGQRVEIHKLLLEFVPKRLMYLEALATMGCLHLAPIHIGWAQRTISTWRPYKEQMLTLQTLEETRLFVQHHFGMISRFPVQVYDLFSNMLIQRTQAIAVPQFVPIGHPTPFGWMFM